MSWFMLLKLVKKAQKPDRLLEAKNKQKPKKKKSKLNVLMKPNTS